MYASFVKSLLSNCSQTLMFEFRQISAKQLELDLEF